MNLWVLNGSYLNIFQLLAVFSLTCLFNHFKKTNLLKQKIFAFISQNTFKDLLQATLKKYCCNESNILLTDVGLTTKRKRMFGVNAMDDIFNKKCNAKN